MSLHVQPPADLATRLAFETLLVDLSARLVAASDDAFPAVVEDALGRVIRFFGADRGGMLAVDPVNRSVHVIHGWYAETLADRIPPELNVAPLFPYGYRLLTDLRQPFVVTSYDDVPPEAAIDRASHVAMGVRSTLNVPIAVGAEMRYIMNMDALREEIDWPAAFVPRLQLLGEIFANTVERRRIGAEIRTSEARLALATSFAGAGPWELDTSTGRIWATPHAKELYGLPVASEVTLDGVLGVVHLEDVERVRGLVSKAVASRSEFADEYRIILPGGDIRWIAARGQLRPEKGAQPHHMLGISLDVTARKQAEAAQRAVVARLEASVDAAGLGFYLTTPPGDTADLDDRARAILGVPPEQEPRLRTFWLEHVHPDDRDRVTQASRDVMEEGVERLSIAYRYQHPTRGLVWLHHTTRTFERDASVRPARLAGVVQDITEQKRTESELREREARLAAAAELAGLGFYDLDYGKGLAFVDDRFRDLCGIPSGQLEGLEVVEFWRAHLHPDDRPRIDEVLQQGHAGKMDRVTLEYRYVHPARDERWFQHVATVVGREEPTGEVRSFGVLQDVTEHRRVEESLRQSLAETGRLKDRLQAEAIT